MKLSLKWLREFTEVDISPKEFADRMTMSGSKVEAVAFMGDGIDRVVVGKILETAVHPNADRLTVCKVDIGAKVIQIVTAATNVAAGNLVPVALDGSTLPDGKKILSGELRGELSEGMFCSISELELTKGDVPYAAEDGILIIEEHCAPGQNITELFGLDDVSVEFEITPNRPDCLCMRGLARESSVTFEKPLKLPEPSVKGGGGTINEKLQIEIKDPELCPRYSGRMLTNVKIEPSPSWMRERLRACGIRPINNIVDITNYVMLEYGQPMHAFDYACVGGGRIVVRRALEGETLETLDGSKRNLSPDMLVIADGTRAVGVAGVMGGANSEITDETTTIVLESANFNGTSVRQTAIALGMRTDASSRFEKGLDHHNTIPAIDRACELVEALGAGTVLEGIIDVNYVDYKQRKLKLEPEKINALLGTEIPADFMARTLVSLGFDQEGDSFGVPSWRADVVEMADLAEEVARFFGYNKIIPTNNTGAVSMGSFTGTQRFENCAGTLCRSLGFDEILTYSFIGQADYDRARIAPQDRLRQSVVITNPLGEERGIMRTTAIPSMLETLSRNFNSRNRSASFYELAMVFEPSDEPLPRERKMLMLGEYGCGDFFSLKGKIEALFNDLNQPLPSFHVPEDCSVFHPGQCAEVVIDGKSLGKFGAVHPLTLRNYDIDCAAYVAELEFSILYETRLPESVYKPLPRYPAITRDLALVCDFGIEAAALVNCIRSLPGGLITGVLPFDVYIGDQIPKGKKSVALSLTIMSEERTLTDSEADDLIQKALERLRSELGAVIR